MFEHELEYKKFNIQILPNLTSEDDELTVVIKNKELGLGFTFKRKTNKTITKHIETTHNLFGSHSTETKWTDYNTKETFNELISEAKVIVDMLYEMENKITERVERKLLQIHCGPIFVKDIKVKE